MHKDRKDLSESLAAGHLSSAIKIMNICNHYSIIQKEFLLLHRS
jgi:hypothetical protein